MKNEKDDIKMKGVKIKINERHKGFSVYKFNIQRQGKIACYNFTKSFFFT